MDELKEISIKEWYIISKSFIKKFFKNFIKNYKKVLILNGGSLKPLHS